MPYKRRLGKARRDVLSWPQILELQIGPHADDVFGLGEYQRSAFSSPADRRAAWLTHREELLAYGNPGVLWGQVEFEGAADPHACPLPEGYEAREER